MDEGGLSAGIHGLEAGLQEFGDQPAELTEITAAVAKERHSRQYRSKQWLARGSGEGDVNGRRRR